MPKGVPLIGMGQTLLGSIKEELLDLQPKGDGSQWVSEAGHVSVTDPPPPWEVADGTHAMSDARRFVDVPANLEVRWVNPKVIERDGWRDWQPVMASDPHFTVKVATMISPEGNIRRGGQGGDILVWMYKTWVLARRKQNAEATARQTQQAEEAPEALRDEFARRFGPNIRVDGPAKAPDATLADGRSMKD